MFKNMKNFKVFSKTLYTAGMPTKEQLMDAANYVTIVINLAPHTVQGALFDEENLVKKLGLTYINIPVDWSSPTEDNLKVFMDTMDQFDSEKVILVHCEANFRASSFVTMYNILRKGLDRDEALKFMREIWHDDAYPIWQEFIEEIINNPKTK